MLTFMELRRLWRFALGTVAEVGMVTWMELFTSA
jgi:hypothetical protein